MFFLYNFTIIMLGMRVGFGFARFAGEGILIEKFDLILMFDSIT